MHGVMGGNSPLPPLFFGLLLSGGIPNPPDSGNFMLGYLMMCFPKVQALTLPMNTQLPQRICLLNRSKDIHV